MLLQLEPLKSSEGDSTDGLESNPFYILISNESYNPATRTVKNSLEKPVSLQLEPIESSKSDNTDGLESNTFY